MSVGEPLLAVDHLVLRYGRITALDGVSIEVGEGEIVAIVGPNGAGKSSLLGSIAGLARPVAGAIRFAGQPILGLPLEERVRRGVSLVLEGRHVFSGLTVRENLELGATLRRSRREIEDEIDAFYRHFPVLFERRDQPAGRLSGGEQQMLVIARALLARPRLLMLDEPSLGLAPAVIDRIYQIVAEVRARGVAVLVVEQNADRALSVADRAYVLNSGRVRLSGRSEQLADHVDFEAAYFGLLAPVES